MTSRWIVGLIAGALALLPAIAGRAEEHGGQEHGGTATAPAAHEHGGKEHAGHEHDGQTASAQPSAEEIRQTIRDHIMNTTQDKGAFTIQDAQTGATRTLTLVGVHDRVGKTGELYYACTDMRDAASGELLDLDFDVDAKSGTPRVVDARIHKVDGHARYTYDDEDNRIPASS